MAEPKSDQSNMAPPSSSDDGLTTPTGKQYLQGWKLATATISLNLANLVGFCDLLGLGAILPEVSAHFQGNAIIGFATTSQLIGATVGQCVLGYLSDIWSRRTMMIVALLLQTVAALVCASSHRSTQLAALFTVVRVVSGVGIGSISNLVNISQNDFSPEDRRLKLQGVQGISVAMGSILGMMVAAVFAGMGNWQFFYYTQAGLSFMAAVGVLFWVPQQNGLLKIGKKYGSVFRTFDWLGIITGTATVAGGLLLLCQYRSIPRTAAIALITVVSISLVAFVVLGWKNLPQVRPIVPFRLFRNQTIAAVYIQNVLFGATYYTFIYYLPVNLQVVRELPAVKASALLIPYFVTHGICSTVSAQAVRWLKTHASRSYSLVFFFGFGIWTLAIGLLAWDSNERRGYLVAGLGVLVGLGTGCVFQNSVMAISAQVDSADKAVAIGTRNILRYLGGAVGTAVSSAIIQAYLQRALPARLHYLTASSVFDLVLDDLSRADQELVQNGYTRAITRVFICTACMIASCVLLTFAVVDGTKTPIRDLEAARTQSASTPRKSEGSRSETTLGKSEGSKSSGESTPWKSEGTPALTLTSRLEQASIRLGALAARAERR